MLTDKELALLGDREAQERLTEAGVLLPCPHCNAPAEMLKMRGLKRFFQSDSEKANLHKVRSDHVYLV